MKIVLRVLKLVCALGLGMLLVAGVLALASRSSQSVLAAPIPPPAGYPKLSLSSMTVTPTLAYTDGAVLEYSIKILNTGAYTAGAVTLSDTLPAHTVYNEDAWASAPPTPVITGGVLTWANGVVGFDSSVLITFSVTVTPGYVGLITNTAVITDPLLPAAVVLNAETRVTDHALFEIEKSFTPELPGANKALTYALQVTNVGQPAVSLPITVTDGVPLGTTFLSAGQGGSINPGGDLVTWNAAVDLAFGESTVFTFSVEVNNVPSGTVVENASYQVASPFEIVAGQPVTGTVVDPILVIGKSYFPDPPGSNTELTYTLIVVNLGSQATNLEITDAVPAGATYLRGGSYSGGVVSWLVPSLETYATTEVTFTVYISDVAALNVINETYGVCSAEGVCAEGQAVPSWIVGPIFEAGAYLDPIAKKPGAGTGPVTPTLMITNTGPGNALDAMALIYFRRIQVSMNDLVVIPPVGTLSSGPPCGDNCRAYRWVGDMAIGDVITFTTLEGQNTVGGEQGTHYTATVVVTDQLGTYTTDPVEAEEDGIVTHYANLLPTKTAPPEIGAGQLMTYTIQVFNSGLSTDAPPLPILTDTVPTSVTLVSISDGGISYTMGSNTVISWTLPEMSPGDYFYRSFAVRVDDGLVSGTKIMNAYYRTTWFESELTGTLSLSGEPVITVVQDVGLIDSYKTVTPTWALPGEGNVLTYVVHIANTSPEPLYGVQLYDLLPWESSTYLRDATASAGSLISDIVSISWTGDVPAYAEDLITLTVLVDTDFSGLVTNTATITHSSLLTEVVVSAVAYITDDPVLQITKRATPDPVDIGGSLVYEIKVTNLGNQATGLVVTDTVPVYGEYIQGTASAGGQLIGETLTWSLPVLRTGESRILTFRVRVLGGSYIINEDYAVRCAEGVSARGAPVYTRVAYPQTVTYLPVISKR